MLSDTAKHVNDIFDRLKVVSHINNVSITQERIDFNAIIDRIRNNLKTFEGYNSIEFVVRIDEGLKFYSDAFLIETILHNMIENAVKFQKKSDKDYKFIRVGIKREKSSIKISFVDNGIGIKETDHDHIYKMFSKAALEHQNVGLGLYIVKQCLDKLSGAIHLLRNKEKFTEFEINIPVQA
jgi:signal transduction histidine kinase